MPTTNVQGINDFMSSLGAILGGPNAKDVAAASVMGAQRENFMADAGKTRQETQMLVNQLASTREGQAFLRSPGAAAALSTPEGRGRLAAAFMGMPDGLQHGPSAVTGMAAFTNPNFVPQSELGTIMTATGATDSFGQTPYGFTMDQQRMAEEAAAKDESVRYGVDKVAETSVGNNVRDNTTSRENNTATNAANVQIGAGNNAASIEVGKGNNATDLQIGKNRDATSVTTTGMTVDQQERASVRETAQRASAAEGQNLATIISGQGDNQASVDVAKINAAGEMERDKLKIGAGVNPKTGEKPNKLPITQLDEFDGAIRSQIVQTLQALNPDMGGISQLDPNKIPPDALQEIGTRAAELISADTNSYRAINQAVVEYIRSGKLQAVEKSGWFDYYPATMSVAPGQAPAPQAPAPVAPQAAVPGQAPAGEQAIGAAPPGTPDGPRTVGGKPVIVRGGVVYAVGGN